ncbi:MAG: ABC transporter ATP-binding protein [Lachnospiraceae bacterium]|nr:ABC transporter ATP-binding protein [Lachnospiraceae bacterium]MBQ2467656.1 ABC transporter ATP-binding protein [Lachnospiraceae bacterium]MBQ2578162.1 ABC transporter ATP-binding protein [Lachnospiraceae bacterium]
MLEIQGLQKHYQNFDLQVTMEVPDGTIIGLVGQNGAGKSTTFKAILGLIRVDGGSILADGVDITRESAKEALLRKQNIGVALSDSGFTGYITPRDVCKILGGMYERFDKQKFLSDCERLELPMDKKIKELSNGNRAKLKVISALCHGAKFIILDEPTAGLDVVARDTVLQLLRDYMEEQPGCSILVSSHISSDLEGLCDSLYMIHQGQIILHEDTDVLLSEYAVLKLSEEDYASVDKTHIIKSKKESFGYACLTNEKQYYAENYPEVVIEKGNIDDLIMIMALGGQ